MDAFDIAQLMANQDPKRPLKLRYGTVSSLNGNTVSVIPDGQTSAIPAIKCCRPSANSRVVLLVQETEWLAVSVIGGDDCAASTHKHAATDITSGTVPVARGGTGVTTDAAIALKAYPVGAVYISYVSTSPATLFGGAWTPITGRFPYFNAGTAVGGSNTHTLTAAEMPSHTHSIRYSGSGPLGGNELGPWSTNAGDGGLWACVTSHAGGDPDIGRPKVIALNAGASAAHNNMPAYQTLYAWRRTA